MNPFERDGFHLLDEINHNFPPTFLWHGKNDSMVPYEDSVLLSTKLNVLGRESKFISTEDSLHGNPLYNDFWIRPAFEWLASHNR
jgi:dipeptidyl aminopeptidase/acylaminoacyl peptidase